MVQWGNAARLELLRPINRDAVLLKQYKLYLDEALSKDLVPLPNDLTIVDVISGTVAHMNDISYEFPNPLESLTSNILSQTFCENSMSTCCSK